MLNMDDQPLKDFAPDRHLEHEETIPGCDSSDGSAPHNQQELVNATNLHSLSLMPVEIQYEFFGRLPQTDLFNCFIALRGSHMEIIGRVLGKRFIDIEFVWGTFAEMLEWIHVLKPYVSRLKIDFRFEPTVQVSAMQQLVFDHLAEYPRLQQLELQRFNACATGPFGAHLRSLSINRTCISDETLATYVCPESQLETLRLINVDHVRGAFLSKIPNKLLDLQLFNANDCTMPFQMDHLHRYVARCRTLRVLNLSVSTSAQFDGDDLTIVLLLLRSVTDIRIRHPCGSGIWRTISAAAVARLPNLVRADLQMTTSAMGHFLDAIQCTGRLRLLNVKLTLSMNATTVLMQRLPASLSQRIVHLTTLSIVLPLVACTSRLTDPNAWLVCKLSALVAQLAALPALYVLWINSTDGMSRHQMASNLRENLPHDLTAATIQTHLPHVRNLCIELPYRHLRRLGRMTQLEVLRLTVLRTRMATTRMQRRRESSAMNGLLADLCTNANRLQHLCLLGYRGFLRDRTCEQFKHCRLLRQLELTLLLKKPCLRRILTNAPKSLTTYNDSACDWEVFNSLDELAALYPHIRVWNLRPNLRSLSI